MDDIKKTAEELILEQLSDALIPKLMPFIDDIIIDEIANTNVYMSKKRLRRAELGMTNIMPNVPDGGRYTHNQTCVILGISSKTLYRHSENGFIKFGLHPANGRRFYTGIDIKRYWKAQE